MFFNLIKIAFINFYKGGSFYFVFGSVKAREFGKNKLLRTVPGMRQSIQGEDGR